jgi:hypothetical protein
MSVSNHFCSDKGPALKSLGGDARVSKTMTTMSLITPFAEGAGRKPT